MDFDGGRYYAINRLMLSSVGLWPCENVWFIHVQRALCLVCFVSITLVQLFSFITSDFDVDLLFGILSYIFPYVIVILKYVAFCMKLEGMRKLMGMIKHDWNTLKDRIEYEIIHKYTYSGKVYSQIFASVAYSFPLLFALLQLIPEVLDLVAPLNQSRPHFRPIITEYFVDSDKYFYPIFLHTTVCILLTLITLMSTTSMYVAYIQHACGMFEIASYRIEHALDENAQANLISEKEKCCAACARIIDAVDIHRRAIEFFEYMKNTFVIMYFLIHSLGVVSLSINLYCAAITEKTTDNILPVLCICIQLFYFFLANYSSQQIVDRSNDFLSSTYSSKWYAASLHMRKLILFIMQRSSKSSMLVIGGIFVVSMEGFAMTMSAAVSYFMLLKLFTIEYDVELILLNLSSTIPFMIYFLRYNVFYSQSRKIRELIEQIRNNWSMLKDEQEIGIMKKCTEFGRRFLYIFTGLVYFGLVGFILIPLLPSILDFVAPLNESRPRWFPIIAEYFINEQRYFYPILLHIDITHVVGITSFISSESLLTAYCYHTCAMFEITCHRIGRMLDENTSILSAPSNKEAIRMRIIDTIKIHQRAIKSYECLESVFSWLYFVVIILGIASLSINLFQLFESINMPNRKKMMFVTFVFGHFFYMFMGNLMGQKIIDSSAEVHRKIYDIRWYITSVQTQKLLLFMMQRSTKLSRITVSGIYPISLEHFTMFASMSLSYFTMLCSVQ